MSKGKNNRAYDIRRDNDTFTVPSVTPYDVDFAILYHLNNTIVPQLEHNNELISVPISFVFGDTPSQIQRYGYVVDRHEKAVVPLITLERTSYSKNTDNPLSNIPIDIYDGPVIKSKIQKNSQFDRVDQTQLSSDSVEFYVLNNPKYRNISYNVNIWTYNTMQMNKVISAVDMHDNTMWGDAFTFRSKIGDFNFDTKNTLDNRRVVRATTTLEVKAALSEEYVGKTENVKRAFSLKRVDFNVEVESRSDERDEGRVIRPDSTYIEKIRRNNNG